MIVILAQFEFPAESRQELMEIVRNADLQAVREVGCLHYRHAMDVSDDRTVQLSEVWSDTDSLLRHFQTAHFRSFRVAARRLRVRVTLQQFRAEPIAPEDAHHVRSLLAVANAYLRRTCPR